MHDCAESLSRVSFGQGGLSVHLIFLAYASYTLREYTCALVAHSSGCDFENFSLDLWYTTENFPGFYTCLVWVTWPTDKTQAVIRQELKRSRCQTSLLPVHIASQLQYPTLPPSQHIDAQFPTHWTQTRLELQSALVTDLLHTLQPAEDNQSSVRDETLPKTHFSVDVVCVRLMSWNPRALQGGREWNSVITKYGNWNLEVTSRVYQTMELMEHAHRVYSFAGIIAVLVACRQVVFLRLWNRDDASII